MKDAFLQIVRLGLGHCGGFLGKDIDWQAIENIASRQGLSAILVDGIERLPESYRPPKPMLLQWIGEVLQSYEYRYDAYTKAIAELAGIYNSCGYKMMVLKGFACSMDWPKPEHRPCGDIDIWLFGKQKEADAALVKEKGVKIDSSHHHHTVFSWRGFMVENHYDFINVHHHKSHVGFEQMLKELGQDDKYSLLLNGEKVYLPSPNLHALFLIKHLMLHFSTGEITLRQLLDWAFFVKAHGKVIDWEWLEGVLEKYGMKRLYDVFNAICVGDLGFDVSLFNRVQFDPSLKDRVLQDILSPLYGSEIPSGLFKRVVWKWHRWKANEWKHRLCYNESMWSAFWSGVWNHLLKPASI